MESLTEIAGGAGEYIAAAGAFVAGLLVNFKQADSRTRALYLIGGMICLAIVLTLAQAVFGR